MIRTRDHKYNRYILHGEELYDLKDDPDELHNLAADPGYARAKKTLSDELDQWMSANEDPFPTLRSTDREGKALG